MAGFSSENLKILEAFSIFRRGGGFSTIYRQKSRPKINKSMDLIVYFWLKNGRIYCRKFANPRSFFDFSGEGTILHFGIFHTRHYIEDFRVPFFRG